MGTDLITWTQAHPGLVWGALCALGSGLAGVTTYLFRFWLSVRKHQAVVRRMARELAEHMDEVNPMMVSFRVYQSKVDAIEQRALEIREELRATAETISQTMVRSTDRLEEEIKGLRRWRHERADREQAYMLTMRRVQRLLEAIAGTAAGALVPRTAVGGAIGPRDIVDAEPAGPMIDDDDLSDDDPPGGP